MLTALRSFVRDDRGGTAIEYALIAAHVALASAAGANALGLALSDMIQGVADELNHYALS